MNKIENLNNYLDSINSPCLNKRILRIYGDYNLDIYIGTKHDYSNIEEVISKVELIYKSI
jgi:hypothetical protein